MATPNVEPVTVTVPTALKLSGIGRTKLYELISTGRVSTTKVGTRRLVHVASLKRCLGAEEAESKG